MRLFNVSFNLYRNHNEFRITVEKRQVLQEKIVFVILVMIDCEDDYLEKAISDWNR